MSGPRGLLRQWLGIEAEAAPRPAAPDPGLTAEIARLNRQLTELRALLHQQADFTVEALQRAGWQSGEDVAQQTALQRALDVIATRGDVVVGPWTGEVGFELLYWIPFLTWLVEQGLDGRRLVVVSRGGAAPWYRHLTTRYVDILDLMSPEEFRRGTEGPKKQVESRRDLDRELTAQARARLGLSSGPDIHPSAMYRLFAALWRKRATVDLIESFTVHRPLLPPEEPPDAEYPRGLPSDYVVAKFYFSKAFSDSMANQRFVSDLLRRVSESVPVVLLSTTVRLDEHQDFHAGGQSGLFVVDTHASPRRNLEVQTRLVRGARGFIGTYGGFSYLAPLYGVRSMSFFSRRSAFEDHHLALAERVFDRLLPGGFVALDRRAIDLVEPAVSRWPSRNGSTPTVEGRQHAEQEQSLL